MMSLKNNTIQYLMNLLGYLNKYRGYMPWLE